MEQTSIEFFGSEEQQMVGRRAEALWALVQSDPRFGTHGRSIGVHAQAPDALSLHLALTRLLGVSACDHLPVDQARDWVDACRAAGFSTDRFEVWESGPDTLALARQTIGERPLPKDVSLQFVDPDTEAGDLSALAEMMARNGGVLLPNGRIMRGINARAVCLFARDNDGNPVASSASVAMFSPETTLGAVAWWGMLATEEQRRGQGLAIHLGAQSMIEMNQRHGFERFFTGIREGNAESERLCEKLGLARTKNCVILAIDTSAFGAARLTK